MAQQIPDTIPQIGPATLAILRQKGITTNLNVLYSQFPHALRPFGDTDSSLALKCVPGIGPGREALLREWAAQVPFTADEKQLLAQESVRRNAERAKRKAEEDAQYVKWQASVNARRTEEDAQRVRSEKSAKRRLVLTQVVIGGTMAGFLYLSIALMRENTGFLLSIIVAGIFSGLVGCLVFVVGSAVLISLE
jgi:hypothetical protein